MGIGIRFIFCVCLMNGSVFVKTSTGRSVSDQLFVEPMVWIKGCHRTPSSVLKSVNLENNEPGRCLQCCGKDTQTVALQLDKCICLTPTSHLLPARAESLCNTDCPGDQTLKCGGQNRRNSTLSVYQRVSPIELQSMKLTSNATGCGVASLTRDGYAYNIVPCTKTTSLVCMNSIARLCADAIDEVTWFEAVAECNDLYSSILPYQTLCQTTTLLTSYWLGMYRSKVLAYDQACKTTTTPAARTSTEKPTSERVVTKQSTVQMESLTTEPFGNTLSKLVEPKTVFRTPSTEPSRTNPESTKSETLFIKQSTQPEETGSASMKSKSLLTTQSAGSTGTNISDIGLTHARTTENVLKNANYKQTNTHAPEQISTKLPSMPKESPSFLEKYKTVVRPTMGASTTSTALSTVKRLIISLLTRQERTDDFSQLVSIKLGTSTVTPLRVKSTVIIRTTAKPYNQRKTAGPIIGDITSTASPNTESEIKSENGGVEIKRLRDTLDNSGKLTTVVSVVGTVMCTLLLAIFLMLCRISRILQKKIYNRMSRPQRQNEQNLKNLSYLTDGASSYPVHGVSELRGTQNAPFPYSGVNSSRASPQEHASNVYSPWNDRGNARREMARNSALDRKSDYTDVWEGNMDDNVLTEDDGRYYNSLY